MMYREAVFSKIFWIEVWKNIENDVNPRFVFILAGCATLNLLILFGSDFLPGVFRAILISTSTSTVVLTVVSALALFSKSRN